MADSTRIAGLGLVAIVLASAAPMESWLELKHAHYSVFYEAGGEADARLVAGWADATESVMQEKYGVTPDRYRISIYLHPAPTKEADVNNALNRCCTNGPDSIQIGTIDMLSPSARRCRT